MVLFPLFTTPEAAIDKYCRQQLGGFSLPPLKPLSAEDFEAAAGNNTPFRLWLRSHATHVGVGATVAGAAIATTNILLTSSPQENAIQQAPNADPQPVTVVVDSTAASIDETPETPEPQETQEPLSLAPDTRNAATQRHTSATAAVPTPETAAVTDSSDAVSAAPQPVVVKKKRRTNRTIVIQNP